MYSHGGIMQKFFHGFFIAFSFLAFAFVFGSTSAKQKHVQMPSEAMKPMTSKPVFNQVPAKIKKEKRHEKKYNWSN